MKAIRVHEYGGVDALRYDDIPVPQPGPGEALVKIEAAGVNYIDTYQRSGIYPVALPAILGVEAAGVVEATGDGVTAVSAGDRVAFAMQPGTYAAYTVAAAWKSDLEHSVSRESNDLLHILNSTNSVSYNGWNRSTTASSLSFSGFREGTLTSPAASNPFMRPKPR